MLITATGQQLGAAADIYLIQHNSPVSATARRMAPSVLVSGEVDLAR